MLAQRIGEPRMAAGELGLQARIVAELVRQCLQIAEAVPELVARSADGTIETVHYQKLDALLLNELQKLHREVQALKAEIARLQQSRDDRK